MYVVAKIFLPAFACLALPGSCLATQTNLYFPLCISTLKNTKSTHHKYTLNPDLPRNVHPVYPINGLYRARLQDVAQEMEGK